MAELKHAIHNQQLEQYRLVLQACNGNLSAAARQLGISRPQLAYRLKAHGQG
ncbi:Bacterial regulatory protein, Fis family [compost metagenome]